MTTLTTTAGVLAELLAAAGLAEGPEAELLATGWAGRLAAEHVLRDDEPVEGPRDRRIPVLTASGILTHAFDWTGPALGTLEPRSLCGRSPVFRAHPIGANVPEVTCNACLNRLSAPPPAPGP